MANRLTAALFCCLFCLFFPPTLFLRIRVIPTTHQHYGRTEQKQVSERLFKEYFVEYNSCLSSGLYFSRSKKIQ